MLKKTTNLSLKDTEDLVASDTANLSNSVRIPEDHTDLGGAKTLKRKIISILCIKRGSQ